MAVISQQRNMILPLRKPTGRLTTNIVNQVQEGYNGLGQLTNDYQEHGGAVNTSTSLQVQYGYTLMSGGANNSNPITMTYPNGRILHYGYSNCTLDTTISRMDYLADDNGSGSAGTHLEDYSYLGLGTQVQRAHPQTGVGVNLTYIQQSGDSLYNNDGGDQYTGLDRFGRVIDQFWTIPTGPTTTDRFQYAYDRGSNALYKNNLKISGLSELYHANSAASGDNATAYDNLNRLGNFIRGTLSASGNNGASGLGSLDTVATPSGLSSHAENWTLDALGNWSSQTIDTTATSRTHNSKNEVTVVGANNLTFDNNGNTTKDQAGSTYIYDAWNRLISVTNSGSTLLATYVYDPRGWRIKETHSSTTTDLYYSSGWQVIEERQGSTVTNQYVWSLAYVDALVLRDDNSTSGNLGISGSGLGRRMYVQQDTNWNTTALVDTSGNVQERFVYDPYGNAQVLTSSGGSTTDGYNWNYLHQGGRLDVTTGLYIFRNRDYSPTLGRWMEQDVGYWDGMNLYQDEQDSRFNGVDPYGLKTYFAIYYDWAKTDKDQAFKRAAETWKKNIENSSEFDKNRDKVILKAATTKLDFEKDWQEINDETLARIKNPGQVDVTDANGVKSKQDCDQRIYAGAIFTHASTGKNPGLNFHAGPVKGDDGTLNLGEIRQLVRLPWADVGTAYLDLKGCEAGTRFDGLVAIEMEAIDGFMPGNTIAQVFANAQNVITYGETQKSSFSQSPHKYIEIDSTSSNVYLGAYDKGWFGSDLQIAPKEFYPQKDPLGPGNRE